MWVLQQLRVQGAVKRRGLMTSRLVTGTGAQACTWKPAMQCPSPHAYNVKKFTSGYSHRERTWRKYVIGFCPRI